MSWHPTLSSGAGSFRSTASDAAAAAAAAAGVSMAGRPLLAQQPPPPQQQQHASSSASNASASSAFYTGGSNPSAVQLQQGHQTIDYALGQPTSASFANDALANAGYGLLPLSLDSIFAQHQQQQQQAQMQAEHQLYQQYQQQYQQQQQFQQQQQYYQQQQQQYQPPPQQPPLPQQQQQRMNDATLPQHLQHNQHQHPTSASATHLYASMPDAAAAAAAASAAAMFTAATGMNVDDDGRQPDDSAAAAGAGDDIVMEEREITPLASTASVSTASRSVSPNASPLLFPEHDASLANVPMLPLDGPALPGFEPAGGSSSHECAFVDPMMLLGGNTQTAVSAAAVDQEQKRQRMQHPHPHPHPHLQRPPSSSAGSVDPAALTAALSRLPQAAAPISASSTPVPHGAGSVPPGTRSLLAADAQPLTLPPSISQALQNSNLFASGAPIETELLGFDAGLMPEFATGAGSRARPDSRQSMMQPSQPFSAQAQPAFRQQQQQQPAVSMAQHLDQSQMQQQMSYPPELSSHQYQLQEHQLQQQLQQQQQLQRLQQQQQQQQQQSFDASYGGGGSVNPLLAALNGTGVSSQPSVDYADPASYSMAADQLHQDYLRAIGGSVAQPIQQQPPPPPPPSSFQQPQQLPRYDASRSWTTGSVPPQPQPLPAAQSSFDHYQQQQQSSVTGNGNGALSSQLGSGRLMLGALGSFDQFQSPSMGSLDFSSASFSSSIFGSQSQIASGLSSMQSGLSGQQHYAQADEVAARMAAVGGLGGSPRVPEPQRATTTQQQQPAYEFSTGYDTLMQQHPLSTGSSLPYGASPSFHHSTGSAGPGRVKSGSTGAIPALSGSANAQLGRSVGPSPLSQQSHWSSADAIHAAARTVPPEVTEYIRLAHCPVDPVSGYPLDAATGQPLALATIQAAIYGVYGPNGLPPTTQTAGGVPHRGLSASPSRASRHTPASSIQGDDASSVVGRAPSVVYSHTSHQHHQFAASAPLPSGPSAPAHASPYMGSVAGDFDTATQASGSPALRHDTSFAASFATSASAASAAGAAASSSSTGAASASLSGTKSGKAGKIPRPENSFFLYRRSVYQAAKAAHPELSNPNLSKVISDMWRNESASVRNHYKELAILAKQEHESKYPDYKYQPRRKVRAGQPVARKRDAASVAPAAAVVAAAASASTPPQQQQQQTSLTSSVASSAGHHQFRITTGTGASASTGSLQLPSAAASGASIPGSPSLLRRSLTGSRSNSNSNTHHGAGAGAGAASSLAFHPIGSSSNASHSSGGSGSSFNTAAVVGVTGALEGALTTFSQHSGSGAPAHFGLSHPAAAAAAAGRATPPDGSWMMSLDPGGSGAGMTGNLADALGHSSGSGSGGGGRASMPMYFTTAAAPTQLTTPPQSMGQMHGDAFARSGSVVNPVLTGLAYRPSPEQLPVDPQHPFYHQQQQRQPQYPGSGGQFEFRTQPPPPRRAYDTAEVPLYQPQALHPSQFQYHTQPPSQQQQQQQQQQGWGTQ
ncbi:hypothetical protein H9P43_000896 [Blastocladiella emersonii ATCC 22665]|nr:hypothetical protein H9P43_000896 [Blastocladiella emersonii ATCC 22665]